jgi:predicted site-specific integrase-resolvase
MNEKTYSSKEVIDILHITNPTLYKWILQKKIHPVEERKGNRIYLRYPESELQRVKKLVRKNRINGNPVLLTNE